MGRIQELIEKDRIWSRWSRMWWRRQFKPPSRADWLVLALAASAAIFLWRKSDPPAPPGFAIGALGAVAMIMTFSKPNPLQKAVVIALAVGLYILEMHLITADRDAQQKAAKDQTDQIISKNDLQTKAILKENQDAFNATMAQFGGISTDTKNLERAAASNLNLSKKNLENITGGDAFAYIEPQGLGQDAQPLVIWNAGKYTLTGVNVVILRTTSMPWTRIEEDIGTIPPHQHRDMKITLNPRMDDVKDHVGGKNYFDSYWIFITAQNGIVTQTLDFRPKIGGGWAQRYRLRSEGCNIRGRPIRSCVSGIPTKKFPEDVSDGKWSDEPTATK